MSLFWTTIPFLPRNPLFFSGFLCFFLTFAPLSFAEDQQPDGRTPRGGRIQRINHVGKAINHPQVITIKLDIFLGAIYALYIPSTYVEGWFFCFSNKPVTFWDGGNLSPTRCFWVTKWLGHCGKGHLFVTIFGYSNFSEAQVGPLSNSSKCWAVMCNKLEITVLVHTITQNHSYTILNCSLNRDLIQQ